MKRSEKKLFETISKSENNITFDELKKDIKAIVSMKDDNKNNKISKKSFFFGFLLSFSILCLAVLIITPTLYFALSSKIESLRITNVEDLVLEYEKDTNFVSDGIEIEILYSDGSTSIAKDKEIVIDSSNFNSSKAGVYTIDIFLKNDENIKTSYQVEVEDVYIEDISLLDYRKTYYLNEEISTKDVKLEKILSNGKTKEVKDSEINLDYSKLNTKTLGKYEIYVSLLTDDTFNLEYEVEVVEFRDIILKGLYYIDNSMYFNSYSPTTIALEIDENNIAKPIYSELIIEGELKTSLIDGKITVKDNKHNQEMYFDPFTKTFYVKGMMQGEPDFSLYYKDENDYIITLIGEGEDVPSDRFVAIDGKLNKDTYLYLTKVFGDIYLDSDYLYKLQEETTFDNDSVLYVKPFVQEEIHSEYLNGAYKILGSKEVWIRIKDGEFITNYYDKGDKYNAYFKSDDVIRITLENRYQTLEYNIKTKTLVDTSFANEGASIVYEKVDPNKEVVIHLVDRRAGGICFTINKGDKLKDYFVYNYTICYIKNVENYNNENIYQDKKFVADLSYNYVSDLDSLYYKDFNNYVIIGTANDANRDNINYRFTYYMIYYKDSILYDVGPMFLYDYDINNDQLIFEVSFEKLGKKYVRIDMKRFDGANGELTLDEESFASNYTSNLYKDFDFVGNYISENNKEAIIKSNGFVGFVEHGEDYERTVYYLIKPYKFDYTNNIYTFWISCSYIENKPTYSLFTISKNEDGIYYFNVNGTTYTKVS